MKFHHIVINFITRFHWHFEMNFCWPILEDFFCSTQKIHISEYVCKTCLNPTCGLKHFHVTFYWLIKLIKNFVSFPKIYYFSQLKLLFQSIIADAIIFFNKVNSCQIENSKYFDAMVKMIYFLEYFFILQNNY